MNAEPSAIAARQKNVSDSDQESLPIRVLELYPAQKDGSILAFSCVEFGPWIVRGVRLMRRDDRSTWLAMPAQKNAKGEWADVCFIPSRTAREQLHAAIEEAFRAKSTGDRASPVVPENDDLPF